MLFYLGGKLYKYLLGMHQNKIDWDEAEQNETLG